MLETDRTLLEGFRKGDAAALSRVFRGFVDDVARTIRAGAVVDVEGQRVRVGGGLPEDEVEALVQETFARAFAPAARAAYDGLRPYGAYLATIARNLLIDRGRAERREGKRRGAVANIDNIAAPAESSDPGMRFEERELLEIVDAVKRALKEPDASIFRLRFEARLGRREVAEALGVTPIMIRRREAQLRAMLLIRLREAGFLSDMPVTIKSRFLRRKQG